MSTHELYNEVAAILKEKGQDDPTWFMAVQIAMAEMGTIKLRELAEIFHSGTSAIKEISKEDFEEWARDEAEAWDLSIPEWLDEVA